MLGWLSTPSKMPFPAAYSSETGDSLAANSRALACSIISSRLIRLCYHFFKFIPKRKKKTLHNIRVLTAVTGLLGTAGIGKPAMITKSGDTIPIMPQRKLQHQPPVRLPCHNERQAPSPSRARLAGGCQPSHKSPPWLVGKVIFQHCFHPAWPLFKKYVPTLHRAGQ